MNRYCALSPLYSTVLPDALVNRIFHQRHGLEEERAQDCGGDNKEDTGTEPRCGCLARVGIAGTELAIDLDTADKTDDSTDGINQLRGGVEIGGHHRGCLVDACQTVAGGIEVWRRISSV